MMDRIEFKLDEQHPLLTGWYINSYDDPRASPVDSVGPYETKTAALRIWNETLPGQRPVGPTLVRIHDAGQSKKL